MRIGIMLRHLGQHGGGVLGYTRNLLRELVVLGGDHEFVLFHRDQQRGGVPGEAQNVREIAVRAPTRLLWDQAAVPRVARSEQIDVLFNPKYSVPLIAPCPTVFVCHGLDWYFNPRWSPWVDRLSHRFLVPRYFRKASRIIAVSETARRHAIEFLGVDGDRVDTVYLGVDAAFCQPVSEERLAQVREAHALPERFVLFCGQIYPPKNFGRLVRAYARVGPALGVSLVVAGQHTWLCEDEIASIDRLGVSRWVRRVGWIDRETLPTFYRLAEALLFPSLYEACPSPILEAMGSGCPIVTSNRFGTQELAGDAACLVDPEDVGDIADGLERVLTDRALRVSLAQQGFRRVREFSWRKCAAETLQVLERATTEAT